MVDDSHGTGRLRAGLYFACWASLYNVSLLRGLGMEGGWGRGWWVHVSLCMYVSVCRVTPVVRVTLVLGIMAQSLSLFLIGCYLW